MSRLPPISPDPPTDEKAPADASRVAAWLITGLLIVIVPTMIGGICWRWATLHGPTTAVIVRGDASLDGAQILVTGNAKAYQAIIFRDNSWQTPILLDPGYYHITVTHHGQLILRTDFAVDSLHGEAFDLPPMVWIVGNHELAAAKIQIVRASPGPEPFTPLDVKLNAEDRYRTAIYLPAGAYRITAQIIAGRLIADVPFTVERTGALPLHVDLTKAPLEGTE